MCPAEKVPKGPILVARVGLYDLSQTCRVKKRLLLNTQRPDFDMTAIIGFSASRTLRSWSQFRVSNRASKSIQRFLCSVLVQYIFGEVEEPGRSLEL